MFAPKSSNRLVRGITSFAFIAAFLIFASTAFAGQRFTAVMTGAQETPPNASAAKGFGYVVVSDDQTSITAYFGFSGLAANVTAAHIHSGAVGVAGPVTFGFSGIPSATSGTHTQTFSITPAQLATLQTSGMYFNIHNTTFPGGEIRGQILAPSCTTAGPVEVESTGGTAVGTPTAYASLGAAFTAINAGALHTGFINTEVCASTTEAATASLDNSGAGSTSYTAVNIYPTAAATVSGSIVGAVIKLSGADNVTIDGRISGTGTARDLTVSNSSATTATAAVWLASVAAGNGASNNVVRNLEIACGATQNTTTLTTIGILMGGTTISVSAADGNDNDNNSFIANRIIRSRYGIVTRGLTTNLNISPVITDNIIGPAAFGADQIGKVGIFMQSDIGATVSRNTVQFVGGDFANTTFGADRVGIAIGVESWASAPGTLAGSDYSVTRNVIHDVIDERTFSAVGVLLSVTNGTNPTNNLVANNFVYNVNTNGTVGDTAIGLGIAAGNGDRVVFNSVRMAGDSDPSGTGIPSQIPANLRVANTPTNLTVKNNSLYNDLFSSNAPTLQSVNIQLPSATFAFGSGGLNNNNYFFPASNLTARTGAIGTTSLPTTFHQTLANWQAAVAPQDANSIQADPQYVSPTDLHIAVASPNVNAGTPAGVSYDIDGQLRVAAPDIGADEPSGVAAPPNDMQATAFINPPNGGNITVGSPFSPQASFTNNGTATQTNVTVRYRILNPSAVEVYNQTFVIPSIAAGQTVVVTFPSTSLAVGGAHTIQAISQLAGDAVPANDTINGTVNASAPLSLIVNTTNDTQDATPGNGICADGAGECSLRAAISEANANPPADTITVPAGTYTQSLVAANEDVNAGGDYDIIGDLVINGAGSGTTFVQAAAAAGTATERVFNIRSGTVTLNGMTIRNGRFTGTMSTATRGAGIENLGSLTLTNSIVRDNQLNSTSGNPIAAGINNGGPALTLMGTTVTANSNVRVTGGSAFGGGVASIVTTTMTITNSSVSGNSATSQAGGFGFGAGLYLEGVYNVVATNSSFDSNVGSGTSGSNGNGVRALSAAAGAQFSATNCTFNNNSSGAAGLNQGVGLQFFTVAPVTSTLAVTLTESTVRGNTGNSIGVGINVTANGGPVTLNVLRSTVSGNTGATNGGGLSLSNANSTLVSPITLNATNSTFSGNTATGANPTGLGGGIFMEQPTTGIVTSNLNFTTVAGNTASTSGGGIAVVSGSLNLKNSIVGDNTAPTGSDINGAVTSQDYNHIENPVGATISGATANNANGDPSLLPLGTYGGPTQTHLPTLGSPVLNTIPSGTNDCGTVIVNDQRLFARPRPVGQGCDKGSVEVDVPTASGVTVGGRVTVGEGRGLRGARVTMTSSDGTVRSVSTGAMGRFQFDDVESGQTYIINVLSRRYMFSPQTVPVTDNIADLNFYPEQ